jgi:hypothetical protein
MPFNKFQWLREQEASLTEYLQHDPEATYDDLLEKLLQDIDTDCIYYATCFEIIKELSFTDFTDSDFTITNVSQAAYAALYEFATENLDINAILENESNS